MEPDEIMSLQEILDRELNGGRSFIKDLYDPSTPPRPKSTKRITEYFKPRRFFKRKQS